MKHCIVTFGCRVNQADSLALESELHVRGSQAVPADQADVVIVNTCSVTASADQGARQTIRRIARDNPRARIIATGCYASRCADEVAALPGVVDVVGNSHKDSIVARLFDRQAPLPSKEGPCGRALEPGLLGRTSWTLRVQTGCEESCSYCVIPQTRGASRSRTIRDVRAEVARVLSGGYKEIVLTGVHLGAYGRDLQPRCALIDLLRELELERALFRISSLEPMDFPLALLDLKVAPHFHLPLQHASNRILRLMQRPYSIEQYSALVDTIRDRLPHAAIGSDLIAGFPGETDDDFDELTSYLERSPLTHLHVFPYSDRPGTKASVMPAKVHGSITRSRAQRLREISRTLADGFRSSQRGAMRPALTIEDGTVAVTDNYIRVPIGAEHRRNDWVTALIP